MDEQAKGSANSPQTSIRSGRSDAITCQPIHIYNTSHSFSPQNANQSPGQS